MTLSHFTTTEASTFIKIPGLPNSSPIKNIQIILCLLILSGKIKITIYQHLLRCVPCSGLSVPNYGSHQHLFFTGPLRETAVVILDSQNSQPCLAAFHTAPFWGKSQALSSLTTLPKGTETKHTHATQCCILYPLLQWFSVKSLMLFANAAFSKSC